MRAPAAILVLFAAAAPAQIRIDYPENGSIFPPEITPPTFIWHDASPRAACWTIELDFHDGGPAVQARTRGEHPRIGEIDARAVGPTNRPPELSPEMQSAWTWKAPAEMWSEVKRRSRERDTRVAIRGFDRDCREPVSSGAVTIRTSKDPVGAPIFYRDVPLMPSELEKGVIKPLATEAVPLIAWRLRDVAKPSSRLLVEGIHSCANCHSFSADGKTLGMDLDGPQNDKGLYAIASVGPTTTIANRDLISWRSFREQPSGPMRVGFMSQVSPDGRYVLTAVGTAKEQAQNYYVANFKDYRFLQVFYATRGVLVWLDRAAGTRHPLPGADDPRYVQTNGVWTPDGQSIVFARAAAQDAYPAGRPIAQFANDPNEVQVRYDLYRIPFNGGRGGVAQPIAGASRNGMSNSFPKVSPDGRWIVYVQARNGLLMRPDSQLYIVPAGGGTARRMRCNTTLMNSWHSFSPNGRWLVFSSKSRSPYTQMFLTHIDENGNDSPAILIENATAANRAANIPEFVNVAAGGFERLEIPAADYYARFDRAYELGQRGQWEQAIPAWEAALALTNDDAKAHNNFGVALARDGRLDDAIAHWTRAVELNDEYADAHKNLALTLPLRGRAAEAATHARRFAELSPSPETVLLLRTVAWTLATSSDTRVRDGTRAVELAEQAARLSAGREAAALDCLAAAYAEAGRFAEAVATARLAIAVVVENPTLAEAVKSRAALYQSGRPFHASK